MRSYRMSPRRFMQLHIAAQRASPMSAQGIALGKCVAKQTKPHRGDHNYFRAVHALVSTCHSRLPRWFFTWCSQRKIGHLG